ncbi:DHH family phosphoesterase [Psychroserpens ponticola]|uniref:Bifunctional oligoribonuclease/PAP phosphatase NrnA n=1 Tax=Psychroserpens ponticola TaxID=2932268 RepID=A0ABY7RUF1_9FLAO|nr:bifunctional oligoribonuclease/PAP phosphatase NrnA [Psychroserpens ponticola]WCO00729.1 bifunctional oligoribonuclease/PAP phosphatase NrnA [Psychroserpens ponticola]
MNKDDINSIKTLLSSPKAIVIIPHKNPDGDAIGSTLGLYHYLKQYNHNVTIIAPNDYPHFLKWMPEEHSILKYDNKKEDCDALIYNAELIFTLDFNSLGRIGNMETVVSNSESIKIMIDHHQQPDDYAKYMYSDVSMSSTCEMVFNFIEMLNDVNKINSDIATCLYTGIMTDTGSFRFASTTSATHTIIGQLIQKGANNSEIHNNIYDTNSYARLQLLGRALSNLKVIPEYRTAYITLTQEELNTFDFKKGDTEGFVNYGLSLKGIIFAAIFIESHQDEIIKISLRSKGDFSVNELSRAHFHGGGHTNAAGGKSDLNLKETIEKFISILPTYKKDLYF